jgi:hypothetical protein
MDGVYFGWVITMEEFGGCHSNIIRNAILVARGLHPTECVFGSSFPSSLLKNPVAVQLQSAYCHCPALTISVSSRVYFNVSLIPSNGCNKGNSPVICNMAGGLYIAPKGYPRLAYRGKSSAQKFYITDQQAHVR